MGLGAMGCRWDPSLAPEGGCSWLNRGLGEGGVGGAAEAAGQVFGQAGFMDLPEGLGCRPPETSSEAGTHLVDLSC